MSTELSFETGGVGMLMGESTFSDPGRLMLRFVCGPKTQEEVKQVRRSRVDRYLMIEDDGEDFS